MLDGEKIIQTAKVLQRRIDERFPDADLGRVAGDLVKVAERSAGIARSLARPLHVIRILVAGLILAGVVFAVWGVFELGLRGHEFTDLADFLQIFATTIESLVFVGAGIAFLVTIEVRFKRRRVNAAVHELRALAHVVDAHQLSKDPVFLLPESSGTESSPERTFDAFLLGRYLDYCSEMLSVIGKIAALYGQSVLDSTALAAIDRIESLTTGLSRKIWQKVSLIHPA